jgi:hypothetical protein
MLNTILNTAAGFSRNKLRSAAIVAAALACTAAAPTAALAHDRDSHGRDFHDREFQDRELRDRDFHDRDYHQRDFHVDVVVPGREEYAPAAQCEQVWVPAEYRTVCERVWVEPVTTVRVERCDVPAQYDWRDVIYYDRYGRRHCERQQVLVSPAHCEERSVPVVVCPGHFEEQTHQVLVCEGHWESRSERATAVIEAPHLRLQIPLPF